MKKKRIEKQTAKDQKNNIRIGTKHKGRHVSIKDIIYLEASDNYTFIYLASGERLLSGKYLKYYADILSNKEFIRVHRSFLVHLLHVREYESKYRLLHLSDKKILSVSYRRKSRVSKIINNKEFLYATQEVA
ncbi:LytR/AlgR family response regulator transcription factor [Kordia sp.]|uniref:LytR/AlgR family response regulator transcription factor n=1 Tax=Kordia sp. TaxID=1965332 RepID=UPI003D29B60E